MRKSLEWKGHKGDAISKHSEIMLLLLEGLAKKRPASNCNEIM